LEELHSKDEEKSEPKVELKPLPSHLRYDFLDPDHKFPLIISSKLDDPQLEKLLDVLRKHRGAIGYSIDDIKGLSPSLCMHRIFLDKGHCPSRQPQRRLNPNMQEVVKKEVIKLLEAGIIYPISDSEWVSTVQVVPKKGGMTVIKNERDELISTKTVTGWCMCIDYRELNKATRKDHSPFLLLIRCWKGWPDISFSVTWMGIQVSFRFLSIRVIRKRRCSRALMVPSLIVGCHLDYVTPLPPFSDA